MINFFLIIYFALMLLFIGGCIVVVYHLWNYRMHNRIAIFSILFFSLGTLALLVFNVTTALKISWSDFVFIF